MWSSLDCLTTRGECGGVFTWTLTSSVIYSTSFCRMSEAIQSAPQEHIPQRVGEKISVVPLCHWLLYLTLESWKSFYRSTVRDVLMNRSLMFLHIRLLNGLKRCWRRRAVQVVSRERIIALCPTHSSCVPLPRNLDETVTVFPRELV